MYRAIYDAIHRELAMLDERFASGNSINAAELEMIDKAAHALKCLATYDAMTEETERRKRYDSYRRY